MPANVATAWSTQLMAELEDLDRRARALTAGLSVEQLNWRFTASAWSVGQCLEHLCLANEVYFPAISASLVGKPVSPVQEIALGWFARWFIRNFIEPSLLTKRASAPGKIAPGSHAGLSVIDRFLTSNQDARQLIRRAAAHNVNRIRFVNPFVPLLRFTVGTGLKITCGHERRHLLQAERVKQSPGFPT